MAGLIRITVPDWRISDSVLSQLLTTLSLYPELITDWRDGISKFGTATHRVDIGLRTGLQPDESFIVRKITDISDILVASPELIAQLGKPTSLDGLVERYPFAGQIDPSTGRAWYFLISSEQVLPPYRVNLLSTDVYSYLQAVLQGKSAGMLSDFLCESYLKSGQPIHLFPEVEI